MHKKLLIMVTLGSVLGLAHIANGAPTLLIDENWDDGNWDGGLTPLTWLATPGATLDTTGGKGRISSGYQVGKQVGIQNKQFNLSTDLPVRIQLQDVDASINADNSRFRLAFTDQPVNTTTMSYAASDQVPGCHLVYAPRARASTIYLETVVNGTFSAIQSVAWSDNYDIDVLINSFTGSNNVTV